MRIANLCLARLFVLTAAALSAAIVPLSLAPAFGQSAPVGLGTLDNPQGDPAIFALGNGISADGTIVVGQSGSATFSLGAQHAFSWTLAGGVKDLGTLSGDAASFANGINADGTTIVGSSQTVTGTGVTAQSVDRPVFWQNGATTPQQLAPLVSGGAAFATRVNADGTVIVGTADRDAPNSGQTQFSAVMWSGPNFTITDLGTLNNFGGQANAADVSSAGNIVVGSSELQLNGGRDGFSDTVSHGFWWSQATGMVDLSTLVGQTPGATSGALAVNPAGSGAPSGSIVVGSSNTSGTNTDAVLWTVASSGQSTIKDLGVLAGTNFAQANAGTSDGSIAVGISQTFGQQGSDPPQGLAFRWTQSTGMVSLNSFLTGSGVALDGISLTDATAISPDGQFIVANGTYPGSGTNTQPYIIREAAIPSTTCPSGGAVAAVGRSIIALGTPAASPLVAAVLPASRSVEVCATATAFATIINSGTASATGCSIAPLGGLPLAFLYQTTNPTTNALTGTANTPVDITAGAAQSFVIALTPSAAIAATNVNLSFVCANAAAAPIDTGLNTLLFSASTSPVPDIVALGATTSNDGILHITGTSGSSAFAVATVNVGAASAITASINTAGATLPLALALCQTNPSTGQCISAVGATVTTTIAADATPTFGIFGTASGAIPFDPANSRIFVQFSDSTGAVHGETSVAVETQ